MHFQNKANISLSLKICETLTQRSWMPIKTSMLILSIRVVCLNIFKKLFKEIVIFALWLLTSFLHPFPFQPNSMINESVLNFTNLKEASAFIIDICIHVVCLLNAKYKWDRFSHIYYMANGAPALHQYPWPWGHEFHNCIIRLRNYLNHALNFPAWCQLEVKKL